MIIYDTQQSHYNIAGKMPNDKGGYRPLMAMSSQLSQQGEEPSVQKCKGVGFAVLYVNQRMEETLSMCPSKNLNKCGSKP